MQRAALFIAALVAFIVPATARSGTQPGAQSGLVECTYSSLHEGTCGEASLDGIVAVSDAFRGDTDRCAAGGRGDGHEYVVCRHDGKAWSEFGASTIEMSAALAGLAGDLVLDILNPPPGSGLVPPVGNGIDGKPNAIRTNDAPAINAAIEYACANGYDVAYLGPGTYRIGASSSSSSFYTGIGIDATSCPRGIKFLGAGVGRTVLLANGTHGQYILYTTDRYVNPVKVRRIGWNTAGDPTDTKVTNITTGVTPPVVTGDSESYLQDGDTVLIRNCSGVTQVNDRKFTVNECSETAPYTCELQDEFGVDIDGQSWDAWTAETPCIVHKLNTEFDTEIAYMTLRDDEPTAHMNIVCSPLCSVPGEESHGIGILQGGGVVEVHDIVVDTVGDEGIDISAPESPTYVHDVTILNAEHGGTPVYQGVGVRIEDVWVHKDQASPWIDSIFGSTQYPPYTAGDGFQVTAGFKNWRVVDLHANRVVMTGLLGTGFGIYSNSAGYDGQYISGVKVTNSIVNLNPNELHCNGQFEICGSFRFQAKEDGYPVDNVEISNNIMTGTAYMELAKGAGGVVVKNNILTPIPTISPKWGMLAAAKATTIEDNVISGFERGCIQYQAYPTHDDQNATVTMTIQRNELRCISNAIDRDAMIGPAGGSVEPPAVDDEGYFRILDNQMIAGSSDFIRNGVKIPESYKNVEICRNSISLDPAADLPGTIGIWSQSEGQLICDNTIDLSGSGIRAVGDRSKVVGNVINGFNDEFASGITISDSSDSLVLNNRTLGYRRVSSTGIKVDAQSESQSGIWIVGNDVSAAAAGIRVDGNGFGIDDVSISGNVVDEFLFSPASAIELIDATDVRVTGNDLTGLNGANTNALLTKGTTDFIIVRDNLAKGGGTLKFGTTGGDASCDPNGGVGQNSTCSGNDIQ